MMGVCVSLSERERHFRPLVMRLRVCLTVGYQHIDSYSAGNRVQNMYSHRTYLPLRPTSIVKQEN